MKRKLDVNDVPTVEVAQQSETANRGPQLAFDSLNLDPRLLQSLAKLKYLEPTSVQARVIPLANEGKNILAKSKTGSGKTAAYVLPCIQSILLAKVNSSKTKSTSILVLVPTRELSDQVTRVFASLSEFCGKDVRALNLDQKASEAVLAAKLNETPDIVVSRPKKVAELVSNSTLSLNGIQKLVVDEADLVLSYGYEEDISQISQALPSGIQTFLISATLTPEVDQLRATFATDYSVVDIEDKEEKGQEVKQYVVKCSEEDKFLLVFVIFKLKLVKGKCIIFVADVDRSYRVKLYLEQFGIRSCILNPELPVNSRLHAVQEFNRGLYDILIAADDQEVIGGVKRKSKKSTADAEKEDAEEDAATDDETEQPVSKTPKRSKDFGVSRGIDFQNVTTILNFDLPTTSRSYTHRIGRTARAGQSGTALSFIVPKDLHGKHKYTTIPSTRHDERVLEKIKARQAAKGRELLDYNFDMSQVEGFRYRHADALKAVTPNKIREARSREIKAELLRSEKLTKHFEENPEDLKALRQGSNGAIPVRQELRRVPDYLLPKGAANKKAKVEGFVPLNKEDRKGGKKSFRGKGRKPMGRRLDPLKSFKTKRK